MKYRLRPSKKPAFWARVFRKSGVSTTSSASPAASAPAASRRSKMKSTGSQMRTVSTPSAASPARTSAVDWRSDQAT